MQFTPCGLQKNKPCQCNFYKAVIGRTRVYLIRRRKKERNRLRPIGATCLILQTPAERLRSFAVLKMTKSRNRGSSANCSAQKTRARRLLPIPQQVHELLAGLCLIESTAEIGRCCNRVLFLHATHLHA